MFLDSAVGPLFKKFLLTLKLLNHEWTDDLFDSNSEKFKALSTKITNIVLSLFSSFNLGCVFLYCNIFPTGC